MGSELYVSPIALSSFCSARLRLPCSGSLGPRFPTFPVCSTVSDSRYYAPLRLPEARLATLRSSLRVAIPCLLLLVLCVPSHSARCAAREPPPSARSLFSGRPYFRFSSKETTGSPKFPCYPLVTCPARGPRWCFRHLPSRARNCCLPLW